MTAGIYRIVNIINGHQYVGSSVDVDKREFRHRLYLTRGVHHSRRLQNAWKFHGEENFRFELLEEIKNVKHLAQREQHWIDTLAACGNDGYNVAPNAYSSLGRKATSETKAKMSASQRGHITSETTKLKISLANTGKVMSSEARIKMSEKAKLRGAHSVEVREKIAAKLMGIARTPEQRANISAGKMGKLFSASHKESLREAWRKRKLKYPSILYHSKENLYGNKERNAN